MAMVTASYRAATSVDKALQPVTTADDAAANPEQKAGVNQLAAQLDVVARCIAARVPTRVYTVQLGGFDTHADERGTQQRLLQAFDTAATGFLNQVASQPAGPKRGVDGLLRIRPAGTGERIAGHRPRHRRAGVRRGRARQEAGSTATSRR